MITQAGFGMSGQDIIGKQTHWVKLLQHLTK